MGKNEILLNLLRKESGQSNVPSRHCGESIRSLEGNRAFPETARRKWKRPYQVAEGIGRNIGCGDRIFCFDNTDPKEYGCTELLQAGCGNPINVACFSIGREFPFGKENKDGGQERETLSGGIRVVGITHIKLESPCVVYNLQVEGHPSYYADGVLVHNCHLIAPDGEGMYRTFLKDMQIINPHIRLIGLTATPFRMKGGLICKPENLLNEVCYEAGLKEMIAQGYLSPLISRAGKVEADLGNLHIRGGEFIADEVEDIMNKDEVTDAACREIADITRNRNTVLIFCTSVAHCESVAKKITQYTGQECAVVTGETSASERAEIIARLRGESVTDDLFGKMKPPLKYCANVSVLTTGTDIPNIDCIILLRPTASPGLLIQMAGRGTRLSPETGKTNCLVLDYGGNILRHGPLDMIKVTDKTSGNGDAPAKKCPQCLALIHAAYQTCPECGYVFPPNEKTELKPTAAKTGIISGEVNYEQYQVQEVYYQIHEKKYAEPGTPKTMRIDYRIGFSDFKSEWVCPEHTGYARAKFEKWWLKRAASGYPIPETAEEAVRLANAGVLAKPLSITVKSVAGEQFDRITKCELDAIPPGREPGIDIEESLTQNTSEYEDLSDEIPF